MEQDSSTILVIDGDGNDEVVDVTNVGPWTCILVRFQSAV